MRTPMKPQMFQPMDIFQPKATFRPKIVEVGQGKHPVLIIDGFYKHPERVRDFFLSTPAAVWKTGPKSRNFKDFYDCRHHVQMPFGMEPVTSGLAGIVRAVF